MGLKLQLKMSENTLDHINLGYACINETLKDIRPKKNAVCVSKTCIARTFRQKGKEYAIELAKCNLEAVIKVMEWNHEHNIHLYRLSSNMFPHMTNPEFIPEGETLAYDLGHFTEYFTRIGELAKSYKQRLTFHPGQYNQIGTPKPEVFKKTKSDLGYHAEVLDRCGLDKNSVMVVHIGGVYYDKVGTMDRWVEQFHTLPDAVKNRIVVENCERAYNYKDVLSVCKRIHRPFVFDTHHHACYSKQICALEDPSTFMPDVVKTWTDLGIKPKFHISEQHPEKRVGAHSDYVETIPQYLFDIAKTVPGGIDIMIEAKKKELAVIRLRKKYGVV